MPRLTKQKQLQKWLRPMSAYIFKVEMMEFNMTITVLSEELETAKEILKEKYPLLLSLTLSDIIPQIIC